MIAARFLPIVRTFAPIVAGIVGMRRGKFMVYNIIGAVAWSFSLVFMGHYLDKLFIEQFGIDLKKHLELIVLFIVLITTAPILIKLFMPSKENNESNDQWLITSSWGDNEAVRKALFLVGELQSTPTTEPKTIEIILANIRVETQLIAS